MAIFNCYGSLPEGIPKWLNFSVDDSTYPDGDAWICASQSPVDERISYEKRRVWNV